MKVFKKMYLFMMVVLALFIAVPCYSLSYDVDTIIAQGTFLSSDQAEMDFLVANGFTGINFIKYENLTWTQDGDSSIWFMKFNDPAPDHFLLKMGNMDIEPYYDHFLYNNVVSLEYAVIDLSLYEWAGSDIDKISHMSFYAPNPVPEPGTMLLMGFGLIGMSFVYRRKS